MDERTNTFIAEWYLWGKTSRSYSDWAVECLENGIDTKNIRILASMFQDEYTYENEFYFKKCLNDLGWQFPSEEESIRRYGKSIARQILEREIDVSEGYSILMSIYYDSDYNDEFKDWGYLYVEEYNLTDEEFDNEIIKLADEFLNGKKREAPEYQYEKIVIPEKKEESYQTFWDKIRNIFS